MIPEKLLEILKQDGGLLPLQPWERMDRIWSTPGIAISEYHQTNVCSFLLGTSQDRN